MGKPAARMTDGVIHLYGAGPVLQGCPTVFIGSLPASRKSDKVIHNNVIESIIQGEPTVLIDNLPAARMGDKVGCMGVIATGCMNVWIGRDEREKCLADAADSGAPLIRMPG